MSCELTHIRQAFHNQEALDHLLLSDKDLSDWVVVAAFYKAVHIVEAIFSNRSKGMHHSCSHTEREAKLKRDKDLAEIWRHYRPILNASLVARYLQGKDTAPDLYAKFSDYMTPDQVNSEILCNRLKRINELACRFLSDEGQSIMLGTSKSEPSKPA